MSKEAEDLDEALRLYREAEHTPRRDAAYAYLRAVVARVNATPKRNTQHGAATGDVIASAAIAITVGWLIGGVDLLVFTAGGLAMVGVVIGALVACGYTLLPRSEADAVVAHAKVWREKRRDLNESILARKVRP